MNNYINYYYNLYPDTIHQQHKFFYFYLNNEKYCFVICDRPENEIKALYELNLDMLNRNSLVHEIILNKDNQVITSVDSTPYILLKVFINEQKKVDLAEINAINISCENIKASKILDRTNWVELWSDKIDFIEGQIGEVGKRFPVICESLSYFIGLGENAISYVKNTLSEVSPTAYDSITVSHKRIKPYHTLFDLYNPMTFIIDHKIRDLSEYIKECFFNDKDVWMEIEEYFQHNILSVYSLRLLYGRLIFPSYYFDFYEQIIEGNLKEDVLAHIISKINDYEKFLNDFYNFISINNFIPPITWINKKPLVTNG